MTDETKTRRRAMAFMGNLIAILSLVVIGYPLAPATIRMMLVGWILVVAAIMRIILGHRFHTTGSAVSIHGDLSNWNQQPLRRCDSSRAGK